MEYLETKSGVVVVATDGEAVTIRVGDNVQLRRMIAGKEYQLFAWEHDGRRYQRAFNVVGFDGPFIELSGDLFDCILTLDVNVEHRTLGMLTGISDVGGAEMGVYRTFWLDSDDIAFIQPLKMEVEKEFEDAPTPVA